MATKTLSTSFAPDIAAQQVALERQRKMAEMLQQQSLEPLQGQTAPGGYYVAPHWAQGAAKLAQALIANKTQSDLDEKQAALGEAQRARYVDAIKRLAPPGVFDDQAPPAAPGQLGSGMAEAVDPAAGTPFIPEAPKKADGTTRQAWARALAAMEVNPDLGAKLIENASTLTSEQKNNAAMGIDPILMGRALTAKAIKEGRMEAQPGNTIIDPITLRPLYTAPDFKTGIQGGFDESGAPKMGRIAGSDILPQIAGETKRAEAAGAAGYDMVTVNTPTGPMMMTREQAVRQSTGQAAPPAPSASAPIPPAQNNMGFPQGSKLPAPTPSPTGSDRLSILQQELRGIQARPDTDPRKAGDMAAINREIAALAQKPQAGIQLQSDADKEAQVGRVKAENSAYEAKLKADQERLSQNTRLYQQMKAAIPTARDILTNAGPTASGIGTLVDAGTNFLGIDSKSAAAAKQLETLAGWMTANVPRMEGPQSNVDVALYQQMAAKVGDSMLPAKSRLDALEVLERLQDKYAHLNGVTGDQNAPIAPNTAAQNKARKYNPATGRIE